MNLPCGEFPLLATPARSGEPGPFIAYSDFTLHMLFMVIERPRNIELMGERYKQHGRMLPGDVVYRESWLVSDGSVCYQIMEAPNHEALMVWVRRWDDVVDFEIVPVLTSQEYWATRAQSV
jgi:hypothetical protein